MSLAGSDRSGRVGSGVRQWVPALSAAAAVTLVGLRPGAGGVAVGVVGAAALVVATATLPAPYAFAAGQVALVAALGGRAPGLACWGAEVALLAGLVTPDLRRGRGRAVKWGRGWRTAAATLVATATLVGVGWLAGLTWGRRWATALAVLATGTLVAYGLHRFEQVQLGVVDRE